MDRPGCMARADNRACLLHIDRLCHSSRSDSNVIWRCLHDNIRQTMAASARACRVNSNANARRAICAALPTNVAYLKYLLKPDVDDRSKRDTRRRATIIIFASLIMSNAPLSPRNDSQRRCNQRDGDGKLTYGV